MNTPPTILAFFGGGIGWAEITVLLVVGLLIFGKRLPEVGRSLGKGIVEFKKGLSGIEEQVNDAGQSKQLDQHSPNVMKQAAEKTPADHDA